VRHHRGIASGATPLLDPQRGNSDLNFPTFFHPTTPPFPTDFISNIYFDTFDDQYT
jgi:hypothetical protein